MSRVFPLFGLRRNRQGSAYGRYPTVLLDAGDTASFVDVKQLREAIDYFISAYNEQAAPFEWRQAEIKQQPLRDNIA
jgi:lipase chaperone LimK